MTVIVIQSQSFVRRKKKTEKEKALCSFSHKFVGQFK